MALILLRLSGHFGREIAGWAGRKRTFLLRKNPGVVAGDFLAFSLVFFEGVSEKSQFCHGFAWLERGGMCGEAGQKTSLKMILKFGTPGETIFFGRTTAVRRCR
jgi:hypothetical protein